MSGADKKETAAPPRARAESARDRGDAARRASDPGARAGWARAAIAALSPVAAQLVLASVVINLLSLAGPIFVLQIYDRVIPFASFETLKGLVIGVAILILFDFLLRQARGRVIRSAALRIDVAASRAVFARLTGLPLRALEDRDDADWRQLTRDADTMRDTLAGPAVLLAVDVPFAILFVVVVAFVAPPLAWALGAIVLIYLALAAVSARLVARAAAVEGEAARAKDRAVGEIVAGRATAKALGLADGVTERWERVQAAQIETSLARGARADAFSNLSASLAPLISVTLTTVGAFAIVQQEMTMGALIAANMLAARALQPITQMIGLWRGVERFRQAAARLDALFAQAPERRAAAVARPRPSGRLRLDKVRFAFEGQGSGAGSGAGEAEPTIDRVSLQIAPGRMVGVFGPNGCGKSTLLKIAQGLYRPDAGRVLLDGSDLAQFGRAELSRWIGYAPQDPFLFDGTIRENIAKGRDDVSDAAILRAAERAAALEFIYASRDGFGAAVGEGGRRLSAGLRQRLSLARALVDDPPVILLDEPTASLDTAAEAALLAQLDALRADRAILLVSHSRAVLEACDVVVAMASGRIAMTGPAEDLLPRRMAAAKAPAATDGETKRATA